MNNCKDIVIIGCPRSGKTTLANLIIKEDTSYHTISLDSLTIAIKKNMQEIGIKEDSKLEMISKRIVPFLASYLYEYKIDYPNIKYLIEGVQINPQHIINEPFFKNFKIICLGYPNATIDEIFNNIRKEDEKLQFSYTKKISDSKLREMIAFYIRYSVFLQKKCNEQNIPFYETNKNRETVLNGIYNTLYNNNEICKEYDL